MPLAEWRDHVVVEMGVDPSDNAWATSGLHTGVVLVEVSVLRRPSSSSASSEERGAPCSTHYVLAESGCTDIVAFEDVSEESEVKRQQRRGRMSHRFSERCRRLRPCLQEMDHTRPPAPPPLPPTGPVGPSMRPTALAPLEPLEPWEPSGPLTPSPPGSPRGDRPTKGRPCRLSLPQPGHMTVPVAQRACHMYPPCCQTAH